MARPTKLAHVVYMTRRYEEMLEWYQTPDGNRMEFQVDCCASADEAHTFMHSDAFAANPVGVEIDPDALLIQYRNGVPMETLMTQPIGPPSPIPPEHGM